MPLFRKFGTMALQNAHSVTITGGSVSNAGLNGCTITGGSIASLASPVPVAAGGTGANNAVSARANLGFADGESIPTLTNVANVSTSSIGDIHFKKTGNDVSGGMRITFDVIAAGTYTEIGIDLPEGVSNFTLFTQASGVITTADQAGLTYAMRADITNDRLAAQGEEEFIAFKNFMKPTNDLDFLNAYLVLYDPDFEGA